MAINPNHIVERQAQNNGPQNIEGAGAGDGSQFIGGACESSKDCDEAGAFQATCARLKDDDTIGQCSGICVTFAQNKAGGGFGDDEPPVINGGLCADQQPLIDAAFEEANQGAVGGNGQNDDDELPLCQQPAVQNNQPAVQNNKNKKNKKN